ncbi:hypothetical protein [Micromonospora aurantiaca (nom. illeg.)]|uniref:hypothetical protein n=1 Tax=Micromonospora aurantiaca (nom. illeg.) TaxID=47850 RepID=UPI0033FD667B
MTTTVNRSPSKHDERRRLTAVMYTGLVLTVLATVAPYIGRSVLAEHVRAGYPTYSPAQIDSAVMTYLVILCVVGVLGVGGWIWTAWAIRSGKRWARSATTFMFALGAVTALTALLIRDTSGDTGLAPLLGWIGVVPCLAGLAAVAMLWRRP